MSTLTWLHLSDLHFPSTDLGKHYSKHVTDSLIQDLRELRDKEGLSPDLIFCTGDIAFSGEPAQYARAADFFDRLLVAAGHPGSRDRIFLVPGNHDVDQNLITHSIETRALSLDGCDAVNQVLLSSSDLVAFLKRLEGYSAFVNSYFSKEHLVFDKDNYFYVRSYDPSFGASQKRVTILGLNSAWAAQGDEGEKVVLGEAQAQRALEHAIAENAQIRIALCHHPFDQLKDFDEAVVGPMLERGCDFLLVGHRHKQKARQIREADRDCLIVPAGAAYEGHNETAQNAYNLACLDPDSGECTIHLREYSDRAGRWVADNRTYGITSAPKFLLPWITSRTRTGSNQLPRVRVVLDGIDSISTAQQTQLCAVVASALQVESERVRIMELAAGCVHIEIEMQAETVATLSGWIQTGKLDLAAVMTQVVPPQSTSSGKYRVQIVDPRGAVLSNAQIVGPASSTLPFTPSYLDGGEALVVEPSVVRVMSSHAEPLFNRHSELTAFQRMLSGEDQRRCVVVHSHGEPGWGKSSLLLMFCQECTKHESSLLRAFLFRAPEVSVSWEKVLRTTSDILGRGYFSRSLALLDSMPYARMGMPASSPAISARISSAFDTSCQSRDLNIPGVSEVSSALMCSEEFQGQVTALFFEELCRVPRPAQVIWMIDTIEATGPETREWLSMVTERIARGVTSRLILVVAGRNPLPLDTALESHICRMDMKALPRDAIYELARSRGITGPVRTLDLLVDLLESRTGGNPLSVCSLLDTERLLIQE